MAIFDVQSPVTMMPLKETTDICKDTLFKDSELIDVFNGKQMRP